jgi:hypothetical protein
MKRLGAFLLLLSGCIGEFAGGQRVEPPVEPPAEPPVLVLPPEAGLFDSLSTSFTPATTGLRRLTTAHYLATVQDLLGAPLTLPANLEPDTLVEGLTAVGATEVPISSRGVELYDEAARALAAQVFADASRRRAFVGCAPTAADDACVRGFLTRFGRKAWRRPLETAEFNRYLALTVRLSATFSDPWKGLEYTTAAFLESPHFLHRVELGATDPANPAWSRLSPYELASRLSYFLWGTAPDDALLAAAERGELSNPAQLRVHVERLVASPKLRANVLGFFEEHFGLSSLQRLERDTVAYPFVTEELGPAMREEWQRSLGDIAFEPSTDFRDVLTSQSTWVNATLAPVYGLSAPSTAFAKVAFPANQGRAGLLGWSGVLAATAHHNRSSPTARGVFVRRKLLCQTIPPPPPNVSNAIDAASTDPKLTLRARLEAHRSNPNCAGCHALLDPIGLGLENYDAVGAFRTTEPSSAPIDATGALDGTDYTQAAALGQLLRSRQRFTDCIVRNLYSHAVGHTVTPGEGPVVRAVSQSFGTNGYHFTELLTAIALSDGFQLSKGLR